MQIEETFSQTIADDSGKARTNKGYSSDKVLSMQIEETPKDGRVQVSPTWTNVVSTNEALTMQIDETLPLTNVDESGKL